MSVMGTNSFPERGHAFCYWGVTNERVVIILINTKTNYITVV